MSIISSPQFLAAIGLNKKTMPTNYNTPGVPDPEVSATAQRAKTGVQKSDEVDVGVILNDRYNQTYRDVSKNPDDQNLLP